MRKSLRLILAAVVIAAAAGCGGTKSASTMQTSSGTLNGAGSSFVYPLVSQWQRAYREAYGTRIEYNPIGSGGGIAAVSNRTVDFGASDAPLTADQFAACHGCIQIPWALSATSIAYRLDGAPQHLRITGNVVAKIFLGQVTRWNDPALVRLNPRAKLPNMSIKPAFRSDSSGTTYNFTDYLSRVSPAWRARVGKGTQVNFPTGVGGKGSSGVAAILQRTDGAVTYVDVAYAVQNKLGYFAVQNAAGNFVRPTLDAIAAAAKTVRTLPADNAVSIVDPAPSAALAYPICTFSYVILPVKTAKAAELKKFVHWALNDGQKYGPRFLFAPIPPVVRRAGDASLQKLTA